MPLVRSLAVAAIAIQAMLLGGVVGVRSSIRSRFMRVGMLLTSAATFVAAAVVLASLLGSAAYAVPECVMAFLSCILSVAELAGVWLFVLYINNQQRRDGSRQGLKGRDAGQRDLEVSGDSCLWLLDDFPELVWRADVSARRGYFNKAWLGFRGRTLEEERDAGWTQGVHPDDLDVYVAVWLAAFKTREAFDTEYRLSNAAGEYRRVAERGRPLSGENGAFLGYIASCSDVTEAREQAEPPA